MKQTVSFEDIRAAAQRVAPHVIQTPCLYSQTLSDITGARIWLKFENLQFTASFKERGACNRLNLLTPQERSRGVIAASAGNHAQGVAYHAQKLGIPAVIVMPKFAPAIKVENTRRFGAEVILHGENFDAAREHALSLARERGLCFIHAFDDAAVIAGQGTIGLEMLTQAPELECLVVAVGGGGLISGVATAAKALKPTLSVIGVQVESFPGARNAFVAGRSDEHAKPIPATHRRTIADGIAVKSPGLLTKQIISDTVDDMLLVTESDVEQAIVLFLEVEKSVVEGAGAAGLAAVIKHRERFAQKNVGLILCGGNIDLLLLGDLIERGMVRADRLVTLHIELPDLPGSLAQVTRILGELGGNIEEVRHQRAFSALPVQSVEVEVVLQTRGTTHVLEILDRLNQEGYPAQRALR